MLKNEKNPDSNITYILKHLKSFDLIVHVSIKSNVWNAHKPPPATTTEKAKTGRKRMSQTQHRKLTSVPQRSHNLKSPGFT